MKTSCYSLLLLAGAVTLLLGACKKSVFDDLSLCPQPVAMSVYSQTPCEPTPIYPRSIAQVRFLVFGPTGVLQGVYEDKSVALSAQYRMVREMQSAPGNYTFVAWAGQDLSPLTSALEVGKTRITDAVVTYQHQGDTLRSFPTPLYVGKLEQKLNGGATAVLDTVWAKVRVQELTYRIHLTVEGLPAGRDYQITVRDDHTRYSVLGDILPADTVVYAPQVRAEGGVLKADLSVLKMERNRQCMLQVKDKKTGAVVYEANLVEDILMNASRGEPPYNLNCDHDFNVNLKLQWTADTWMVVQVKVNDWNVIVREVDLGA